MNNLENTSDYLPLLETVGSCITCHKRPFRLEIFIDSTDTGGLKTGMIHRLVELPKGVEISRTFRTDWTEKGQGFRTLINHDPVFIDHKKGLKALKARLESLYNENRYSRALYGDSLDFTVYR